MQARMNNPAMVVPDALKALYEWRAIAGTGFCSLAREPDQWLQPLR
jgi:hypothetical protein